MRFAPDRLAGEIADFLDEVWAREAGAPGAVPAGAAGARPASASL
jgi:hypothetical protein